MDGVKHLSPWIYNLSLLYLFDNGDSRNAAATLLTSIHYVSFLAASAALGRK